MTEKLIDKIRKLLADYESASTVREKLDKGGRLGGMAEEMAKTLIRIDEVLKKVAEKPDSDETLYQLRLGADIRNAMEQKE